MCLLHVFYLLSTLNIVKNIAYMSVVWVMRHMTVMTYLQWRSVTNDAWLGGTIRFWSSESNVFMMSTAAHLCRLRQGNMDHGLVTLSRDIGTNIGLQLQLSKN